MKKRISFRKLAGVIHLWLGLSSGLLLFTICLTGTIYVFRAEVEEQMSPEKYKAAADAVHAKRLTADEIMATVSREAKGKTVSLTIPEDTGRTWLLTVLGVKSTLEKGKEAPRAKNYLVNTYNGKIISEASTENTGFFGTVLRLHRWFLLPKSVGSTIGGVAVLLFVVISLSGLVIWFPKKLKYWKQGLGIKRKVGWKRTNHDLHKTLGFFAVIFCLLWALTGLNWSFNWYKKGVSNVLHATVFGERNNGPIISKNPNAERLSVGALLNITDVQLPYPGTYRIQMPADTTGTAIISKFKTGFFAMPVADILQIDAATGEVLKQEKFSDKKFNQQLAALIKPMHTGEIFGTFSKIIYFLICLITTSLPITGTLIWWNKRKKRKKTVEVERKVVAERPVK